MSTSVHGRCAGPSVAIPSARDTALNAPFHAAEDPMPPDSHTLKVTMSDCRIESRESRVQRRSIRWATCGLALRVCHLVSNVRVAISDGLDPIPFP